MILEGKDNRRWTGLMNGLAGFIPIKEAIHFCATASPL
jgi:hypothetical protein